MMSFLKKLHKWVGLIIGLQVLLWLSSGLVISVLDPAKVNGREWMNTGIANPIPLPPGVLLEADQLPGPLTADAFAINLAVVREQPVYRIRAGDGEKLVNAIDGSILVFDQADAEELARRDFTGKGAITATSAGIAPDLETRNHSGPYWKVQFSDEADTAIYISASTGDVLERRNQYWRVRDFFWMLHIMDYQERQDFNNILIIIVSLISIWLGLSGFILLFGSFTRHDFYFLNLTGQREQVLITLIDPALAEPKIISLRKGSNLFLSLATHNINLPSICGGGGECGKCRVQVVSENPPPETSIEQGLVPKPLRNKGFRLACQHEAEHDITLMLKERTLEGGH